MKFAKLLIIFITCYFTLMIAGCAEPNPEQTLVNAKLWEFNMSKIHALKPGIDFVNDWNFTITIRGDMDDWICGIQTTKKYEDQYYSAYIIDYWIGKRSYRCYRGQIAVNVLPDNKVQNITLIY